MHTRTSTSPLFIGILLMILLSCSVFQGKEWASVEECVEDVMADAGNVIRNLEDARNPLGLRLVLLGSKYDNRGVNPSIDEMTQVLATTEELLVIECNRDLEFGFTNKETDRVLNRLINRLDPSP